MTERHCIQRRSVFPMLGAGSLRRSRLPRSMRHSMPGAGILRRSRLLLYVGRMEGFGVQGMPCTCDLGCAEEPQQAALSRSRLRLYGGRMEGFGVHGMPCTCDLGRAEEPQQAAPSLRHSMPGAGTP